MKEPRIPNKKERALSHGFLTGGLILLSVGLALGPGHYIGGLIGLIIAAIWCFAGGFCFAFANAFAKLIAKK
jgi:drug/metabolite transporter (DMT)-like permease